MCPKVLVKEFDVHFSSRKVRQSIRKCTDPGPGWAGLGGPGRAQPRPQRQGAAHRAPAPGRSLRRADTRRSQSCAGGRSQQRAGPAGAPGPLATAGRGLLAAAAEALWRAETQPGRRSPCPRPPRRGLIGVRRRRRAGRGQPARAGGGGEDVVVGGDATRATQWPGWRRRWPCLRRRRRRIGWRRRPRAPWARLPRRAGAA
jgi:hypothetical protein